MARIRTIKPEFWEDDVIGSLNRETRLLFIASWNLADDEGLLRWSAAYLKASAFMYDDDIGVAKVQVFMNALSEAGLVHSYNAGKAQQPFAYIVNFHKHQKINRPTPSKLLPPSVQSLQTRMLYLRRDDYTCHLCGTKIDETGKLTDMGVNDDLAISLDHVTPVSKGGSDYPSNIRASHQSCNKGRGNRTVEEYRELIAQGKASIQFRYKERFSGIDCEQLIEGLNECDTAGREGKGREIEGMGVADESAPQKPVRQKLKKAPLPADYTLTETLLAKAKAALRAAGKPDVNFRAEFVRFCNHFWAPETRNREKSDWDRAFINWCLSEYSKPAPRAESSGYVPGAI